MNQKIKYSKMRNQLSESEKRVLDYCLQHPQHIERITINQLAKELFISPSTISRTAQKLGFHGFKEMKYGFLKEEPTLTEVKSHNGSMKQGNQAYFGEIQTKLQTTCQQLDELSLEQAVSFIHDAGNIEIFAVGGSEYIGKELNRKLRQLNYLANARSDWDDLTRVSKRLDGQSLAIFISQTGETPLLLNWAQNIHDNRVRLISITGNQHSSLQSLSTLHFYGPTALRYQLDADISSRLSLQYLCDLLVWKLVEIFESH
ncbi:MurR/RpiR family transcriptional regulator [Ignavigranum ruoffiae]